MENNEDTVLDNMEAEVFRLFETVNSAAQEVCGAIKRPDFHGVIVRANWDLFVCAPDAAHNEEQVTLRYDKFYKSVDEVATAANRMDLLEVILDANWELMKCSYSVARMRS